MATKRNTDVIGRSFMFPPEVIDDIHVKAELGRYRMRGFSIFKKIPSWDDLTFLPGTLTRFVIEGYREKMPDQDGHRTPGKAAAGAGYPDLYHGHEFLARSPTRPRRPWPAVPPWPVPRPVPVKAA